MTMTTQRLDKRLVGLINDYGKGKNFNERTYNMIFRYFGYVEREAKTYIETKDSLELEKSAININFILEKVKRDIEEEK